MTYFKNTLTIKPLGGVIMAKKQTSKKITKKDSNNLPAVMDLESQAMGGFEDADKDAYAIPFLAILQPLSPQVDSDDAKYIKGAKAGMIFNTVTEELYDGKKGINLAPVKYQRQFIEWIPRIEGGGFVAMHAVDSDIVENAEPNEKGIRELENGHELKDHRNHFVVLTKSMEQALISMTSTQIKKSRKWMSQLQALKVKGKKGMFTPPMFYSEYCLTTVKEENDQGKWYGWKIERIGEVNADVFNVAIDFKKAIEKGIARADFEKASDNITDEDAY